MLKFAIFVAVCLLVAALCFLGRLQQEGERPLAAPSTGETATLAPSVPGTEAGATQLVPTQQAFSAIDLDRGLIITDVAAYTGAYVEDGSDEVVSNVLMIVLENTSGEALQYATISLTFGEATAQFSVSNLPAGARAVLLEQNRMEYPGMAPDGYLIENVIFLPEFELYADLFEISGSRGTLTVKNISGQDIAGDVYVYYKNSAQDIFYGGITYRSKADGLAAGEEKSIIAAHYNPTGSTIVMVTYAP